MCQRNGAVARCRRAKRDHGAHGVREYRFERSWHMPVVVVVVVAEEEPLPSLEVECTQVDRQLDLEAEVVAPC